MSSLSNSIDIPTFLPTRRDFLQELDDVKSIVSKSPAPLAYQIQLLLKSKPLVTLLNNFTRTNQRNTTITESTIRQFLKAFRISHMRAFENEVLFEPLKIVIPNPFGTRRRYPFLNAFRSTYPRTPLTLADFPPRMPIFQPYRHEPWRLSITRVDMWPIYPPRSTGFDPIIDGIHIFLTRYLFGTAENPLFRKVLACIPIMGIIPTVLNEYSLSKKITESQNADHITNFIRIKNHYKIASIVRKCLSITLIITGLALKTLSISLGISIAAIAVGIGCVAYYNYAIYKNRELIKELDNSRVPRLDIRAW